MLKRAAVVVVFAVVVVLAGNDGLAQDRPLAPADAIKQAEAADPILGSTLREIERLLRDLEGLDLGDSALDQELALAAQFGIAGQRLKTIGFDRALDEAIAAAGGEGEIAASLAADPELGFTQEEALAAVRELLESDMSEIYMDLSEAFRAAARGVDP